MVTVCLLLENGQPVGFTATGHAAYAQQGSDIVCSAISALTQTAVLGLQSIEHLPLGVSIDEEEGIHCVLGEGATPTQLHDAQLILRTMHLGLSSIQSAYEDTLNITQREV